MRYFERERPHSHSIYYITLLRLFIIVVNFILSLIYKLNFIIGMYILEKNIVYIGFPQGPQWMPVQGFRRALGTSERVPCGYRGAAVYQLE